MKKKKKTKKNIDKNKEISNRYCPICGIFIKKNSLLHHCDDNYLKKIYKTEKKKENKNPTYSDFLDDAEFLLNPYLNEEDEE